MANDAQGLALTGTAASAAAYDRALGFYFGWSGDPVGALLGAVEADPGFALGHATVAAMMLLGGGAPDDPLVTAGLAGAEAAIGGATAREQAHLAAAQAWQKGQVARAAQIYETILADHPRDALALNFAYDIHFGLGWPEGLRNVCAGALPHWDRDVPLYGFVLGRYAFGLEETGDLARAEERAREALDLNPEDAWAVHAVAHVMETASRQADGIAFMKETRPDWSKAELFSVHNGWHLGLYMLEEGRFEEVLADYDRYVAPRLQKDSLIDLIDAAQLLWRIELAGGDVGDRWGPLATAWMRHIFPRGRVWKDLHLAMAISRGGTADDRATLVSALDAYERDGTGDNHAVYLDVGKALVDVIFRFADGDYGGAIEMLMPVRHKVLRTGNSHAQRDLFAQTLIAAAERSGETALARTLWAERLAVRPTPHTRARLNAIAAATA